jgi:Putative zinc-finger
VRCEAAEAALSERMDGDLDAKRRAELEHHLATCDRCRAFERGAGRIRVLTRLEAAEPVPDLVPQIMRQVRAEAPAPLRRPAIRWARHVAAFAAGAIAAGVLVAGLPGARRGPSPALAREIPMRIADASSEVTSYRATFRIVERGFHPRVPRRAFLVDVAFRAPERFRSRVTDLTSYPGPAWPATNVTMAVDGGNWLLDAPRSCPREALPACAPEGRDVLRVTGRPPFDGDAPLPTDIVLPVRTLAGSGRVSVRGEEVVLGRDAVIVELAYRDASPLFGFFQGGGVWRPFYPHDRVLVSLDRETWFPLAFEVRAAASPERIGWASANGLPEERAGTLLLRAEAERLGRGPSPSWRPTGAPSQPSRDLGFRDVAAEDLNAPAPRQLAGLRPSRSGRLAGPGQPADQVLLSYARGLSWLVIRETRAWEGPSLFGDLTELARPVRVGAGVGYYEPASGELGRRLGIHGTDWDIELESNLPLTHLLKVAGTLPVVGRPAPAGWLDRLSVDQALAEAPFALMPAELPTDYRPWAARNDGPRAVTVWFRRPGVEPGPGIVLHQAAGVELPPPLEGEVLAVRVRGTVGRYSPGRAVLEWTEGNVYRSLGGGALDLAGLLAVADSLEAST